MILIEVVHIYIWEMKVSIAQLCPTLCDPKDCSLPGSSVHMIQQQKYWSWLPFPSPGDPPEPGIELGFTALHSDSLLSEPPGKPVYVVGIWDILWTKCALLQF